jgi:phage terminase small subunit
MTKASKIHLPCTISGEAHKTLCGRPVGTLAVSNKGADITCAVCKREHSRGNARGPTGPVPDKIDSEHLYSDQEIKFANHSDVVTNAFKAALACGYSESYAKKNSSKLRERLFPLIKQVQEKRARKGGISAARIQTELAAMGFSNVLDYVVVDEKTGTTRPKGLHELTRSEAAAIQEYELETIYPEEDGVEFEPYTILKRIKLIDKRSALIDLGKTLGMFNEKMQMILRTQDTKKRVVPLEDIPTDDLEAIEKILVAAQGVVVDKKRDRKAITVKPTEVS